MDEILHRFPVTAHPFQTLNLSIDAKPLFKRGMSANGRNPASGICVINIDIRGVRGVSQSTCYALLPVAHARFCPPTVWGILTKKAIVVPTIQALHFVGTLLGLEGRTV